MANVFGWQFPVPSWLGFLGAAAVSFAGTLIAWLLISLLVYLLLTYALKWLTRKIPGEVDNIVLEVVRKPLFFLALMYGVLNSLTALPISPEAATLVRRLSNTAVLVVAAFVIWKILEDVVVYLGESWVKKTESRVDDVLLPVVRLFGPPIIGLSFLILVLDVWGINVTSVLVGAGVIGLVLGLAMQDTLSNVFSGLSLIIDSPFRTGDLLTLPSGQVCRVERIGMRATQLCYLDEHSTVYMPNKELANIMLVNITRPSVDLAVSIDLGLVFGTDLARVESGLLNITNAHPSVLGDIDTKIDCLSRAAAEGGSHALSIKSAIARLEAERAVDFEVIDLIGDLDRMTLDIKDMARGGLTREELASLQAEHLAHVKPQVLKTVKLVEEWSAIGDHWAYPGEQAAAREFWATQNAVLLARWDKLEKKVSSPGDYEMRLDELTRQTQDWVKREYKQPVEAWKEPGVGFKSFGASTVNMTLGFFVDDIRLENNGRKGRVTTDIAKAMYQFFQKEGIKISSPQMEVRLSDKDRLEGFFKPASG